MLRFFTISYTLQKKGILQGIYVMYTFSFLLQWASMKDVCNCMVEILGYDTYTLGVFPSIYTGSNV